jgi:hypothetical protein
MNDLAMLQGYGVRFNGADWGDTGAQGLNFTIYYDIYSTSEGYIVYVCVHGWGHDHLFRARGRADADIERAFSSALLETVVRMNDGWVCS